MPPKTITISKEAYEALSSLKQEHESFTDVILRIVKRKKRAQELLAWVSTPRDHQDLADALEEVYKQRDLLKHTNMPNFVPQFFFRFTGYGLS